MRTLIYFSLFLFFYSCGSEKSHAEKEVDNLPKATSEDTLLIKELYHIFTHRVVNRYNIEAPRPEIGPDGYYIIDIKKHQDKLRELEIFTEDFINHEADKFKECHDNLEKIQINRENEEEGIEHYGVEGCSWFDATYYTANQDPANHSELKNLIISGNTAESQIHFVNYFNEQKSYNKRLYLQMKFTKTKGKWWIDSVERVWNDYD